MHVIVKIDTQQEETAQKEDNGMKKNSGWRKAGLTAGGFALGAAVGSTLALLYAPTSGQVTRKRIGLKFRSWERATARQLQQTKKLLAKKAWHLREAASEKFGNTREWLVERMTSNNGKHHPSQNRRVVHHA